MLFKDVCEAFYAGKRIRCSSWNSTDWIQLDVVNETILVSNRGTVNRMSTFKPSSFLREDWYVVDGEAPASTTSESDMTSALHMILKHLQKGTPEQLAAAGVSFANGQLTMRI